LKQVPLIFKLQLFFYVPRKINTKFSGNKCKACFHFPGRFSFQELFLSMELTARSVRKVCTDEKFPARLRKQSNLNLQMEYKMSTRNHTTKAKSLIFITDGWKKKRFFTWPT